MSLVTWLRAITAVGSVADAAQQGPGSPDRPARPVSESLETRMANVVVSALHEAFDRDRARFDLERDIQEAQQLHRERTLRLDWLRETGRQQLSANRQMALASLAVWVVSAGGSGWLSPLEPVARWCLGLGWLGLASTLALALVGHQRLTAWLAAQATPLGDLPALEGPPRSTVLDAVPWCLVAGFLLTATSLFLAL